MNTSYQVPLAVLAGLGVASGVLLFLAGLRGRDPDAEPVRSLRLTGPMAARLACGLAAGLLVLVLTRWVAFAIGACVVVLVWNKLLGGARSQRAALARLEALAAWIESLRDTVATGTALPEALPASARAANPLISVPLRDLVDRLQSR
ncbi:MAG TPA: type II secretion system protein, partial [Actinomycetes bacterium]|nr:type II secretion system protein [Actinomycetes bacterium]